MGASLSSPLIFDPFNDQDPETQRRRLMALKGTSPVTSSSSLASSASIMIMEATGNIIMGTNAPQLYEHALIGDWEALLKRVTTHPKEACYKDKRENTALHVSCRRQPPPNVVQALIQANPEALTAVTHDGLTPLHFSCFCGSSPETVRLTMTVTTLRDLVDRRGRTPLHCVCAGFRSPHRLPAVEMLLQADPSSATAVDERGRTPLSLIVDDYVEELHEALLGTCSREDAMRAVARKGTVLSMSKSSTTSLSDYNKSSSSSNTTMTATADGNLCDCWSVVTLLLRAAYAGTLEDNSAGSNEVHVGGKFRILHAAVGIGGCPAAIIRLLLKLNPTSILEKDGDLNVPLHVACKTVGQSWSRKVVVSKRDGGVVVYNADFGKANPEDDVTAELITAHPGAAGIPDDSGKVPLVLAVESGKPWATSLKPLWEAYPFWGVNDDAVDHFPLLEKAMQGALASMSPTLRGETIKTMKYLIPLWPAERVDDMVLSMIQFARESSSNFSNEDEDDEDLVGNEWKAAIQGSTLQGVAAALQHTTSTQHLKDSPQQALEMALPLLSNKYEVVRIAAAKVLGYAVERMGIATTEVALRDVIFLQSSDVADDGSVSTMGQSCANSTGGDMSESDASLHGRAMACYYLLDAAEDNPIILSDQQRNTLKQWAKHEATIVRKGACWAVGSVLRLPKDLKEFRSPLLKLMRATEDVSVHMALSQSLVEAAKKHNRLFLCKSGLPILDGALMLSSMSRATSDLVQQSFQSFLWHALQKQESGLQEYMDMAEGENGRIMMSLVTKRLSRLPVVPEEDDSN